MTVTATEREIRSPQNGRVPRLDSPAARAGTRARVPVTARVGQIRASLVLAGRRWWAFTARPSSLRAAWALSAVDPKRIPGNAGPLRILWQVSNWTDRLVVFSLIMLAPTGVTGPLRWIAARPTRRFGFYIVLTALAVTYALRKG